MLNKNMLVSFPGEAATHQSGNSSKRQLIKAATHRSSNSSNLHKQYQLIESSNL